MKEHFCLSQITQQNRGRCANFHRYCPLTHCGLVTPYGGRDLGQYWFRQWLVAWRHQAITWTNVDWSSAKTSDIHIRAMSQQMPQSSITKIRLKVTYPKFHSNFPGASELTRCRLVTTHGVNDLDHYWIRQWLVALIGKLWVSTVSIWWNGPRSDKIRLWIQRWQDL